MVARTKETAEKKLLKMIEASSGLATASAVTASAKIKSVKKFDALDIVKVSNKFLVVVGIIILLLVGYELKKGMDLVGQNIRVTEPANVENVASYKETLIQKLSYYLATIDRRNLFKPYEEEVAQAVKIKDENSDMSRKIKKLRLVGISWFDAVDTASAMIEDTDQNKTFFLQKGEKIGDSNITIKTIYADSVKLGNENEEILLKYGKSQL